MANMDAHIIKSETPVLNECFDAIALRAIMKNMETLFPEKAKEVREAYTKTCNKLLEKARKGRMYGVMNVSTAYVPSKWTDEKRKPYGIGRIFAEKGVGGQFLPRRIRHTIYGKLYWDLDFEQCHQNILEHLCKLHDIPHTQLSFVIEHREELLRTLIGLPGIRDGDEAKTFVLKVLNSDGKVSEGHPPWLRDFGDEMENTRQAFRTVYADFWQYADDSKGNVMGSLMNVVLCTYELKCLLAMCEKLEHMGYTVGVLANDGCMVERTDAELTEDVLEEIQEYVLDKTGLDMPIKIKSMDQGFSYAELGIGPPAKLESFLRGREGFEGLGEPSIIGEDKFAYPFTDEQCPLCGAHHETRVVECETLVKGVFAIRACRDDECQMTLKGKNPFLRDLLKKPNKDSEPECIDLFVSEVGDAYRVYEGNVLRMEDGKVIARGIALDQEFVSYFNGLLPRLLKAYQSKLRDLEDEDGEDVTRAIIKKVMGLMETVTNASKAKRRMIEGTIRSKIATLEAIPELDQPPQLLQFDMNHAKYLLTMSDFHGTGPYMDYMNRFFAGIKETKIVVEMSYYDERRKTIDWMNWMKLKTFFDMYNVVGAKSWYDSPMRREYKRMVLRPKGDVEIDELNIFRPFLVERLNDCDVDIKPDMTQIDHIPKHTFEVLSDSKREIFHYHMSLFKRILISKEKTGIVLVWLSDQGTGKSIFVDFIGRMMMGSTDSGDLGSSYLHVLDETKVVGKFNGCLAGKLLVILDEAGTGPYRDLANIFKGLVTELTMQIEKKGMEATSIDNLLNFIVLSNGERPVKVEKSDRRFAVFNVSEKYKGDYQYFNELHEQLTSPLSAYHFYMYLKQYDTKGVALLRGTRCPR
jgi:Family of unknown function (DUF5906)